MKQSNLSKSINLCIQVGIILTWYLETYVTRDKELQNVAKNYMNNFQDLIRTRGLKEALIYFKHCRNIYTRNLSGSPLAKPEIKAEIDIHGWPKVISDVIKVCERIGLSRQQEIRVCLTLLTVGRCFSISQEPDLEPIVSPSKSFVPQEWEPHLEAVMKNLRKGFSKEIIVEPHYSTKSGPNGQAMASSHIDARLLESRDLELITKLGGTSLVGHITALTELDGNPISLSEHLDECKISNLRKVRNKLRILSYFPDVEGKVRVIAILDYWSQCVLKPLHDKLNKILSRLKEDCTFDQSQFKDKLPKKGPYYSFDLSNATDRLPIVLQGKVLELLMGKEYSDAWQEILVGREYFLNDVTAKYNAGQPMGAYSSWPMLALTHHIIVRMSARMAGVPFSGKYVILGDDVVIACPLIAEVYKKMMATLDTPISLMKTHVSDDTYEFAKRWVHKGHEVSPFPLQGIRVSWKRYYLLQNILETASGKSHQPIDGNANETLAHIESLITYMGKPRQAASVCKLYRIFRSLITLRRVKGDQTDIISGDILRDISAGFSLPSCIKTRSESWYNSTAQDAILSVRRFLEIKFYKGADADMVKLDHYLLEKLRSSSRIHPGEAWSKMVIHWPPLIMYPRLVSQTMIELQEVSKRQYKSISFHEWMKIPISGNKISLGVINERAFTKILGQRATYVKYLISWFTGSLTGFKKSDFAIMESIGTWGFSPNRLKVH